MRASTVVALGALVLVGLAAFPSSASAHHHRYAGPHPIPEGEPGDFCHIQAPHVHVYAPERVEVLYRDYDGWAHFVGDPTPFGYEGPRHTYHGAHPVAVDARVEIGVAEPAPRHRRYCYLEGPHYHIYEPAVADFEVRGGVHWYVGDYSPRFRDRRDRYTRVNAVYEPLDYRRPVVEVEPPSAYVDVLVAGPPGHARGRARAGASGGARVHVPLPFFRVEGSIGVGSSRDTRPPGHRGKGRGWVPPGHRGKGKGWVPPGHRGKGKGNHRERTEIRVFP